MGKASRDPNYVTTLLGVQLDDLITPIPLVVDQANNRLLVSAIITSAITVDTTGLATSVIQTNRTQKTQITDGTDDLPIGAMTAVSGTTSTTGAVILAVSGGFKVRLYHVSYVPTTAATVDIDVSIAIGATTINGWRTNFNGGGYMRSPKGGQGWWEGGDGEDVTITLSAAQPVRYNLEYDIVAV